MKRVALVPHVRSLRWEAALCGAATFAMVALNTKPSVLIVDDEADLLELLTDYLSAEGFEVVRATDGIDALSYMYATRPSAVLIDLKMPRMNGLEVIAQIRNDRLLADIPVVAMSGDLDLLARAKLAGANEVLRKPVEPRLLAGALLRAE